MPAKLEQLNRRRRRRRSSSPPETVTTTAPPSPSPPRPTGPARGPFVTPHLRARAWTTQRAVVRVAFDVALAVAAVVALLSVAAEYRANANGTEQPVVIPAESPQP
jgi:hypothetical protein